MKHSLTRSGIRILGILVILGTMLSPAPGAYAGGGRVDSVAAAEFLGEAGGDWAGYSLALVGDVDGDGFGDLVVGAPHNGDAGYHAGAAYLVLGGAHGSGGWGLRTSLGESAIIQYTGEAAEDGAGRSVAGAGDVNGDGYADFLVGAYLNDDGGAGAGAAYLILGSASPAGGSLSAALEYAGEAASDLAGESVAGAGDVDGDGYADFLVGAYVNDDGAAAAGAAYLVRGSASPAGGSLSTAIEYTGEAAGDNAGRCVAGAGDIDGDGYGDFLVGADGNDDGGAGAGAAYLVLGSNSPAGGGLSAAIEYTGEAADNYAGYSVAGAGDVDGDGYTDFLVGRYRSSYSEPGAAYLVLGSASPAGGSLSTAIKYAGGTSTEKAGYSVAGAGDVDGDGFADFLVGAPFKSYGSTYTGSAYLVLGSALPSGGSLSAAIEYIGESGASYTGNSLAGAGDANGDGFADILIGAYTNPDAATDAGAVYLLYGTEPAAQSLPSLRRQLISPAGRTPPVNFEPEGVQFTLTTSALAGGDISVRRHSVHPCNTAWRLAMPIWTLEGSKIGPSTEFDARFRYTEDHIAGMTEAVLKLWWRPAGQSCTIWTEITDSAVDTTHNYVSASRLSRTGQFTIADAAPSPTMLGVLDGAVTKPETATGQDATLLLALLALASAGLYLYVQRRLPHPAVRADGGGATTPGRSTGLAAVSKDDARR